MTKNVIASLLVFLILVFVGIFTWPKKLESLIPVYAINEIVKVQSNLDLNITDTKSISTSTIYLAGDVMLGRHVEFLMNKKGTDYPYKKLDFLSREPAYVIGNFESASPLVHQKTPNFGMRFSVAQKFLPTLRLAGFTHMGLANNHSLDAGETGYSNTRESLMAEGIYAFGHPAIISSSSVAYFNLSDKKVAVIAIHTLYKVPSDEELNNLLLVVKANSDWQIAYIHWGEEYNYWPTSSQRKLATFLVAQGIDLIVGHHPHVIQQIDTITGVPVFYSLGNLIFDQYFSEAVQTGLVLKLSANDEGLNISALPITSINTPAQPRLMTEVESVNFYKNLADYNTNETLVTLQETGLNLSWSLASSTEMAIIDQ